MSTESRGFTFKYIIWDGVTYYETTDRHVVQIRRKESLGQEDLRGKEIPLHSRLTIYSTQPLNIPLKTKINLSAHFYMHDMTSRTPIISFVKSSAPECNVINGPQNIYSPDDLTQFSNCTTINGAFVIGHNYTGAINLSHVTNFNGFIQTEDSTSQTAPSIPGLTSIQMDNLATMGRGLFFANTPALTTVSFRNLAVIDTINFAGVPAALQMSFPALKNVTGDLYISPPLGRIDFPLLATANTITVLSSDSTSENLETDLGLSSEWSYDGQHNVPALNINFPSLQNTTELQIVGNISSLSMPSLTLVGPDEDPYHAPLTGQSTMKIETWGNPINISFPVLQSVKDSYFTGDIQSLNMPALQSISSSMTVTAFIPLDIDFPTLQNATDIEMSGNISSAVWPSLKTIGTLSILSDLPLDCAPSSTAYNSSIHDASGLYTEYYFSCRFVPLLPLPSKKHLSPGAIAGIVISCVAFVAIIVCGALLYTKRRKA
ncbi:hypothetical protein G7Y89_g3553 [Cudoniella acicularis]|uniref:Uncharacterized protein n=1 Tax=Cudoniella acicularis TaxID=354080 RepID=A0A8H4RT06_9HELO|nr:hypothetical protein G7Y89_g3553 [Cudoniella acicularis]